MEEHGGKVRFGVVGTNFITDWVIAGARQDDRLNWLLFIPVSRRRRMPLPPNIRYLILLPLWKRWQKAR